MSLKELDLHLTNKCVLLCRHCVFSSGERQLPEINFDEISKIATEFAKLTSKKGVVNIFGGESLLRKDIFKIIQELKKNKLSVGITTNCQVPEKLILQLFDQKIDRFTTNLDGAIAKTHDWLRNFGGNFDSVIKMLKLSVSKGIFTTVNSVIHKGNIHEVIPILELCDKLNVDALAFYFLTPTGRGLNLLNKVVGPNEWLETKAKVIDWINKNSPNFGISWEQAYEPANFSSKSTLPWRCEKGHTQTIFIRCDGAVYSCALLEGAPCSLGNIKKSSIQNILNCRAKYSFTRNFGCPALAFHVNKNLQSKDPRISTNLVNLGCPYEHVILNKSDNK